MADFDLITYNVRGLRDLKKKDKNYLIIRKSTVQNRASYFYREHILLKKLKSFGKLSGVVKLCFHMGVMIAGVF